MTTYLTADDVAERLHLAPDTVREYMRAGTIPAAKIGRHWRTTEQALDAFMAREIGGTGKPKPSARTHRKNAA